MIIATEFTKMSKELGWDKRDPEPLPTKARALELSRLASEGDRSAYKIIFTLNRFGAMPLNDDALDVVNIIFDAFCKHRHLYEQQHVHEDELRRLGYDPRGRGYVAAMIASPWRGKLNYDPITSLITVGSLPVFREDAEILSKMGISAVVDMCHDNPSEKELLRSCRIDHLLEFCPDGRAPAQDQLDRVVSWISKFTKAKKKVYIHCHAGRGRAPTVACAYLIAQGLTPMQAFDKLYEKRKSTSIQVSRVQHEALATFHARHQKKIQEK